MLSSEGKIMLELLDQVYIEMMNSLCDDDNCDDNYESFFDAAHAVREFYRRILERLD